MPAPRVAPLRTGSGAEAMNDESLARFGVPLANARGRPPGSPDAICEERGPSSHVQYATGATAPAWVCQYRVIGGLSGLLPWPGRRRSPLPGVVERPHHTGRFALAAFACAGTVLKNRANSAGVTWLAWSCTSNASAPAQAAARLVRTYHWSRLSPVSFGWAVSVFPRSRPGVMMHLKAWACASAMKLPM